MLEMTPHDLGATATEILVATGAIRIVGGEVVPMLDVINDPKLVIDMTAGLVRDGMTGRGAHRVATAVVEMLRTHASARGRA